MKFTSSIGLLLLLAGCGVRQEEPGATDHGGHAGHGHQHGVAGKEARLIVETIPERAPSDTPVRMDLMIHDAGGARVRDFEVVHEHFAHLAIISEDMQHFAHLHPEVDSRGRLSATYTFPAGGRYRLFVDFATAENGPRMARGELHIDGDPGPAGDLVTDAPGVIEADGVVVDVSAEPLLAGREARIRLDVREPAGGSARLEPAMGELGHLMVVGAGTWRYAHAHPTGGDAAEGWVEFASVFDRPGLYKAWGQVKHDGRVRVVPFVVRVK